MPDNASQSHSPDALGGVLEVTVDGVVNVSSSFIGRSIIDGLWRRLTVSSQIQEGDYFMDQSRLLLRRHLQLIEVREQDEIRQSIDEVRNVKNGLANFTGSRLKKLREARKYRRLSQETYRIVKIASERGIDGHLMCQIADAVQQHGRGESGTGSGPDAASMPRNPFTDSHAISTLTDVTVSDVDRIEMSTYQDEDTGDAAFVLGVVAGDQSVQHIVASFPTRAISGVRTDGGDPEAPAALSLHQEDGTTPRFFIASQDQGAETRSLNSLTSVSTTGSVDLFGTSEGSNFYPEPRP